MSLVDRLCSNVSILQISFLRILSFVVLQFAEARRKHQIEQLTKDRKQLQSTQMLEWKKRFIEKQNEATRRVHEDNVKHLQVN